MSSLQTLLTVKETAQLLKLNPLTVYEYIRTGKLQAIKLGRHYRVTQTDLTTFINTHKTDVYV